MNVNARSPIPPPYTRIYEAPSPAPSIPHPPAPASPAPVVDERTPLHPTAASARSKASRARHWYAAALVVVLLAFVLQNLGVLDTAADRERGLWAKQRAQWAEERTWWDETRDGWEREKVRWEGERARWESEREQERTRRKDVEMKARGAHFTELQYVDGKCRTYGTRAYTARLLDIPGDLPADIGWYELCMDMSTQFHGRWIRGPNSCERGRFGAVWATWYISDEPECRTYWDGFAIVVPLGLQVGLLIPLQQRYSANLMNLRHGDDWDEMCRSTPANIFGHEFDGPTACHTTRVRILSFPCSIFRVRR
ncbi:uncharacterized protein BXZ73DRAFT_46504 [Epithele typhae]|uniref:uncharacterized protein n=1 Tax=Epithele typhae TaxID=378194 RepID=UPI002008C874|nr:uncharacterized protein BXZ73DRAFT_46504 [Epithele typhae]KAH9933164.1 hypothetical protein BXZ73DRAFT_46504 [Epithele typhae]